MRSPGPQGPQATPTPRYWEFHPVAASPGSLGCCPVPWLDECPVFICVGKWPHIDNYWHMPRLGGRNHYLKFLFCLTILGGSGYWHIWFIMMANMILLGFLEFPFPHLRSISEMARWRKPMIWFRGGTMVFFGETMVSDSKHRVSCNFSHLEILGTRLTLVCVLLRIHSQQNPPFGTRLCQDKAVDGFEVSRYAA